MILNEISPFIIIDGLDNEFSKNNFVHFLSKPSSLIVPDLNKTWESTVYTSKLILELSSCYNKMNIGSSKFHQLIPNERTRIEIPSTEEFFMVTLLETNCPTGKVLLLFENSNGKRFLYPGEFTVISNLSLEVNQLINKVDVLYLDNTLACNRDTISVFKAFSRIEEIVKKYPKHNFILNIPHLGYEELIIRLSKMFKMYFNDARRFLFSKLKIPVIQTMEISKVESCLGFSDEEFLNQTLRIFKKEKVIFIRFEPKLDTLENTGVYYVNWSPHPTFNHLFAFVLQIKPKKIYSIHSEFPEIPEIIQELCDIDSTNDENNNEDDSDELGDEFFEDTDEDSSIGSIDISVHSPATNCNNSLSSNESDVTVIFNPSQNMIEKPAAQSTPMDPSVPSAILLKRKPNVLENCKKKLSRNFPQTLLLENKGVNYLD